MAEERTLGLARAHEQTAEEPSKEELQRRLGEARDSISNTVTEIKETVANQVQAVKDTLDWREQFKKRPVAWSAGAAGVGFRAGLLHRRLRERRQRLLTTLPSIALVEESRHYASQALVGSGRWRRLARLCRPNKEMARTTRDPDSSRKLPTLTAFEQVRTKRETSATPLCRSFRRRRRRSSYRR